MLHLADMLRAEKVTRDRTTPRAAWVRSAVGPCCECEACTERRKWTRVNLDTKADS